jgi:5-methylthioribose kinase
MFGFIEKWALKRLLKKVAESLPIAQDRIKELWEENKEEIIEKVTESIKATITKILKKALAKRGIEISEN